MIRTAIHFGVWTALCMVLAIVGFFLVAELASGDPDHQGVFSRDNPSWRAVGFLSLFAPVAGLVAGLLWALFHRNGHSPKWWGYVLLAGLVVAASHILVFGGLNVGTMDGDVMGLIGLVGVMFLFHGWLSVPVALIGTALFVLWNRRRVVAA